MDLSYIQQIRLLGIGGTVLRLSLVALSHLLRQVHQVRQVRRWLLLHVRCVRPMLISHV